MGWTTPTDRSTGYTVTAADYNIVEDDLTFLYGDAAWTNVSAFTNSWVTHGASVTPRFILHGRTVYMDGQIQSGTIGSAAFTLPAGYRPSQALTLPVVSNALFGVMTISTAGVVVPAAGSNVYFTINCSFSVV